MTCALENFDLPLEHMHFKIKEKRHLGEDIIYVKDIKTNDPYGMAIDPRRGNKDYKKYTRLMIINTQLCTVHDESTRYCFIRG